MAAAEVAADAAEVAAGAVGGWGSYEIVLFRRCPYLSRHYGWKNRTTYLWSKIVPGCTIECIQIEQAEAHAQSLAAVEAVCAEKVRTLESTVQTQSQEVSDLRRAYADMYSFLTQMRSGASGSGSLPDMPPPLPPPPPALS
ncbi:hypothetical protein PIB30_054707 [Stylosanthes scabra]|uniref:Uncharacterized protein n=1 Tax=Stylosanthes scabra TaxID=79078 RepID=A0ABU6XGM8_9FABA|nr:hypothetical protein [Stylosanthes scabra]